MKGTFFLFFSIILIVSGWGYENDPVSSRLLEGEFFAEMEPVVPGEVEYPIPQEELIKRLLAEARFLYSGMLYGFTFSYVPSDSLRRTTESFELVPIYEIPWGDENMVVRSTRVFEGVLYAVIRYYLEDFQIDRLRSWSTNLIPVTQGRGEGDMLLGYEQRIEAVKEGFKLGIRRYIQEREYNKPRKITGELLLAESPLIMSGSGVYVADVKFRLRVDKISHYREF